MFIQKHNNRETVAKLQDNSNMKQSPSQFWVKLWQYMLTTKVDSSLMLELLQIVSAIASLATLSLPVGAIATVIAILSLIDRSKNNQN